MNNSGRLNVTGKSPISRRLKEARLSVGISQKKLGIAAGIDEFVASARMNQYETGKHVPDFEIVQNIAKALNISAAFFYTTENELAELIKIYGALSHERQQQALLYVRELLS